jgi:hypothetical protein
MSIHNYWIWVCVDDWGDSAHKLLYALKARTRRPRIQHAQVSGHKGTSEKNFVSVQMRPMPSLPASSQVQNQTAVRRRLRHAWVIRLVLFVDMTMQCMPNGHAYTSFAQKYSKSLSAAEELWSGISCTSIVLQSWRRVRWQWACESILLGDRGLLLLNAVSKILLSLMLWLLPPPSLRLIQVLWRMNTIQIMPPLCTD